MFLQPLDYMADSFVFIESEDEVEKVSYKRTSEEFRPSRMGLGYTMEMFKAKREKEKEKKRLEDHILGKRRRKNSEDDMPEKPVSINTDDEGESRGGVITSKIVKADYNAVKSAEPILSKSQKKRLRLKNKKLTT